MTERLEVYKSGDVVIEVLDGGEGQLVCSDQPMEKLEEKTADSATEKHVPVVEQTDAGVKVVVGSVPHPMEEKHFIEWIEIQVGNQVLRQYLKPGDAPEAFFAGVKGDVIAAREYCNVHGLWKS